VGHYVQLEVKEIPLALNHDAGVEEAETPGC
jgi:hypothetical protein